MTKKSTYTGDPSEIVQYFPKFNLQLLCCRFWWLLNWEHPQLAFPYWRIYYNSQEGGFIKSDQKIYPLTPDTLYLIAPNTRYSSYLYNHTIPKESYHLKGGRIADLNKEKRNTLIREGAIEHLFIHFTVGYPYDNIQPAIFAFPMNEYLKTKISTLQDYLSNQVETINFGFFLAIQSLICELFAGINQEKWEHLCKDDRVSKVIHYIENHIDKDLSNDILASITCMSTNAFAHLFKEEIGITLQRYIKNKRINQACVQLLHSNDTIETIAENTGFSNRYHFTRVFQEITGTSPARYKKEYN
ncbi:MAG: AraC family transcriptional regulator [Bacteroidales bacterium]